MAFLERQLKRLLLTLLVVFSTFTFTAAEPVRSGNVEAELISSSASPQAGEEFWVGVVLRPDEHWHTYWRNPGDTGLATTVEWTAPAGVTVSELHWPFPSVYDDGGLVSYIYEDEVVLLAKVTVSPEWQEGAGFELRAKVNWLACKEACVLGKADLSLGFPTDSSQSLASAAERLPDSIPVSATAEWLNDSQIKLRVQNPALESVEGAYFFSIPDLAVEPSAPQSFERLEDGFTLTLVKSQTNPAKPESLDGVLVVEQGGQKRAFRITTEL
ncbi:MAG: hypothetical protein KC800_32975 [Candidatus Eremiobacteraeota bacterium]|nr:hypothetical protein [Candidatus Eremiobacteraeota bacterium]